MTNDRAWLHAGPRSFPVGVESTVTLTVVAGVNYDPPGAVLFARLAPVVMELFRHYDQLGELGQDEYAYALADVRKVAALVRGLEEELIVQARANGASWRDLGTMLDTHFSSARDRHDRIKAANERGMTADALTEEAINDLARAARSDSGDD